MPSKGRNLAKLVVDTSGRQEDQVFSGDYIKVPVGTTAERPSGPSAGYVRFNTTTATLEQHDGSNWTSMAKPPIISTVSYSGSTTAVDPDGGETITISGTNFSTGVNVLFGTTYATSVTRTNSTSLSVTVPALTANDYDVTVINNDGMQAILTDGLSVNGAPAFSTASGSLGNIINDAVITNITIVASEDDSGDISYTVTTGSLPTGLSIDSSGDSAGTISGTPTGYTSESTVNFTITATDDENQTTTRNFSLTVLVGFYDYEINQSLIFDKNDNHYLSRNYGGNRTSWTYSIWTKPTRKSGSGESCYLSAGNYAYGAFIAEDTGSGNQINWGEYAGGYQYQLRTEATLMDLNSWYHLVFVWDSANATASERMKIYINGERLTYFAAVNYPSQNYLSDINSADWHAIGSRYYNGSYDMDGYLAEAHFIDGSSLDASYFGETKNGVWTPKEYTGSYGSNGWYLDFADSSNFGNDVSGNNNDWNVNGVGFRNSLDTPTNNFFTLNPLVPSSKVTLTEGALKFERASNIGDWGSTIGSMLIPSTGKWYFEMCHTGALDGAGVGIARPDIDTTQDASKFWGWHSGPSGGVDYLVSNPAKASITQQAVVGDIYQVAFDADNGKLWIGRNNTWGINGGTPVTPTDPNSNFTNLSGEFMPAVSARLNGDGVVNFGQDSTFAGNKTKQNNTDDNGIGDFYYTPPSGFLALCNENLPNNTFDLNVGEKPSEHFNVVTWTGTDASKSITGVGFQPDFVWIKCRSHGGNTSFEHILTDSVRGANKTLNSDSNNTEVTNNATGYLSSFDSDGFTVSSGDATSGIGRTYVAWCWKAGGTAVSNTDGSLTTQVSANTDAGFSIITYTGAGSGTSTIGHGLNQAPEFWVTKPRTSVSDDQWFACHTGIASDYYNYWLHWDTSDGAQNAAARWGGVAPTDSVISIGNYSTNKSGDYVCYAWHSVPGFSKVGSYNGNTSTDGTFVYTGFRPAFVLIKYIGSVEGWNMQDTERYPENGPNAKVLRADLTNAEAESSASKIDFVSNGFKHRATDWSLNATGYKYVYIAFAEDPFKYGNAR